MQMHEGLVSFIATHVPSQVAWGQCLNHCFSMGGLPTLRESLHLALLLTQFCWGSAAVVNKLGLSGIGQSDVISRAGRSKSSR